MERATSPALECRSLLVLGGARSGKSRYALALAEAAKPNRLLIATASAGDDEMAARIALHRAERSQTWTTIEEQQDL
ncbi:MAG TPA: bifunctional adenosylcobinamide kinase/adenosylcobinamide-phosphate guanylyltransferase, partial [Roseiarcus sp.]|nr:bifunctional adenosylcobinamide kinase/adenosylcobinamide-phosphate guanylyltransferase [Roseiarcus sp.]